MMRKIIGSRMHTSTSVGSSQPMES